MEIKTIIFKTRLHDLSLKSAEELKALIDRIGRAIQLVHPHVAIDPSIECAQSIDSKKEVVGAKTHGTAGATAAFEVKRVATGKSEYYKTPNDGTHVQITKEEYDAAHATAEQQANIESAKAAAGVH